MLKILQVLPLFVSPGFRLICDCADDGHLEKSGVEYTVKCKDSIKS